MRSVGTVPGMGGWIQVWYNWYIVRTFVNATMYPNHQSNKNGKKKLLDCMLIINKLERRKTGIKGQ
jgi:hypothetical protein